MGQNWIDFLREQLLVWGIGLPVILICLWWIWTPRRKKTCGCGFWIACDDCSRQMDAIDVQLRRKGK